MTEIIPAIIAENFKELNNKLSHYISATPIVQIDICDGKFVAPISWPMHTDDEKSITDIINEEEGMPYWDKINFEFDLMVKNGHEQFDFFLRLGAERIIFHIEAEDNKDIFKEFLEGIDMYVRENVKIGIALNTTTPIDDLKLFIPNIDFVQCMGIEKIGFQGQKFDERVLQQISSLRQKYPKLVISVDGSVNKSTAKALVEAGANRLVIGSALNESYNLQDSIEFFRLL